MAGLGHGTQRSSDIADALGVKINSVGPVTRRTFGPDIPVSGSGVVNLNVLAGERAVVQVAQVKPK